MPGATFLLEEAFVAFGVVVSDGVMVADGPNPKLLSSASAGFKPTDVGRRITVADAGPGESLLDTFIAQFISATEVILQDPAAVSATGSAISYAQGVYRLSDLIEQGDVDDNHYEFLYGRRIQLQVNSQSPAGKIFVGGPYVTPDNAGIELEAGGVDNFAPGASVLATTTADYLCSDVANALVNVYWVDDFNLSTPA